MPKTKVNSDTPEEVKTPDSIEDLVEQNEKAKLDEETAAQKAIDDAKNTPAPDPIDPEKIKEDVVTATNNTIAEAIKPLQEQLQTIVKEQTPAEKSDYQKFVDNYTEKNGKAPEWEHVATFLEERAVNRLKSEQEADRKAQEETTAQQKKQQEETDSKNFTFWQTQLTEMETSNLIPKMGKPEAGDPGFDARVGLYALMQESWKTQAPMTNLYEVLMKHPIKTQTRGAQPAGADAPVNLGQQSGASPESGESINYGEIHNGARDLESFAIQLFQNGQKGK